MLSPLHSAVLLTTILTLSGCQSGNRQSALLAYGVHGPLPVEEGAYFVDVAAELGLDFVHTFGDAELSNIVETVGSGAAFLDFDQDGFMDLYVVNGAYIEGVSTGTRPPGTFRNQLYRNVDGKGFVDVTVVAGVGDAQGYGMGVAVADFDNDGFPDIFVCNYGPNVLYRNNGNGTFTDVTARAGVAGNANTVGAVWFDFDNDGLLDLYAGNYLDYDPDYRFFYAPDGFPPPMAYSGQPDVLYRNLGDGRFQDVTAAMGVYFPDGRMMGVAAADYNDDGFVDLYVANDAMANYLFRNEGGDRFTEIGLRAGVAYAVGGEETSSMTVSFGDYDGDGRLDFFVSDIHYSALFRNQGGDLFTDVTVPAGIAAPSGQYDGWGGGFFDYDNDGDLDLFKANGSMNHLLGEEDQLFENDGRGRFLDVSLERGSHFHGERVGRGAAFGDYDNDGNVDIVIVNLNDPLTLLRNQGLDANNWVKLLLVGTASNRDGVGARVRVEYDGRFQVAEKVSASGYLSTNDPRLHFGLGSAESVDRIEIRWPSGRVQTLSDVAAGQIVTVVEEGDDEKAL